MMYVYVLLCVCVCACACVLGEVVAELCQLLRAIPSPVSLSSLVEVERYMVQTSGAGHFSSLGCGSFLSLLTAHQELLTQVGGGVMGMAGSPGARVEARKARMMGVVHQLERCLKDREVRTDGLNEKYENDKAGIFCWAWWFSWAGFWFRNWKRGRHQRLYMRKSLSTTLIIFIHSETGIYLLTRSDLCSAWAGWVQHFM